VFVVLIPAFEPDQTLRGLVHELITGMPECPFPKLVLVNDGSSKSNLELFEEIGRCPGVRVLTHDKNLGKGAALKTGFRFVLDHIPEAEVVVTADADGQHLPFDIIAVGERAVAEQKTVLGVREFPPDIPLRSRLGNLSTRWLFGLAFRTKITDTQTGLRGISRGELPNLIAIEVNRYDFEFEALIRLVRKGGLIQLPISTVYEPGNPSSHFNPLLDSARIYAVFARHVSAVSLLGIFDWLMFTLFSAFHLSILSSLVAARIISVIVYFFVARSLVFRSSGNIFLQAVLFVLLATGNVLLLWPFITFAHEMLGAPKSLAMLIGNALMFGSNFLWQNYVIFMRKE
jgi:glycosyltransferase involved in cell wall biosynthesis